MANSSLVEYTKLSPNHSGKRTHAIDRITPHCVVGQLGAVSLGEWFAQPSTQASCNYVVDCDGRVALIVDEDKRAWTSSSNANDQRAVTIECASDMTSPYAFRDIVYNTLIELCVDICLRNKKDTLIWIPDKNKALSYQPKQNEMLLTVHQWFAPKDCPGEWMMNHMADLAQKVTSRLGKLTDSGFTVNLEDDSKTGKTKDYQQAFIDSIAKACVDDMKTCGVLASVSIAQAILESGWGESELAKAANNLFGMKTTLSGVTWPGKTYEKETQEYYNGKDITIKASFRAYDTRADSIADHGHYLTTAKNGNGLRYAGMAGETDPAKVCDILRAGGYATDPSYNKKILEIIDRYNLTKYDSVTDTEPGLTVSPEPGTTPDPAESDLPFSVRVEISDLNLRSGAGTGYEAKGFIPKGEYTITKVKKKKGRTWGKIKPVSGWICLDYVQKV